MKPEKSPFYDEVYRFLVKSPSPEDILAFQPSEATSRRIRHLLSENKRRKLTLEEAAELDEFDRIEHMMRMFKIYATEVVEKR